MSDQINLDRVIKKATNEITLLQEGKFKCVSVSFLNDSSNRTYTYKTTLDFAVYDLAVVYTASGYKLVQVVSIDVELDYDVNYEYKWVVDRVDTKEYLERDALEQKAKKTIKQERAKAKLLSELSDDVSQKVKEWF